MKKHSLVAVVLVVLLLLSALSSCNGSTEDQTDQLSAENTATTQPTAGDGATEATTVPEPGENGTVIIGHEENRVAGVSFADNLPLWAETERLTGIKIEWDIIAADYDDVMRTRIAAGAKLPDLFMLPRGMDVTQIVKSGAILNLNDYVNDTYLPNLMQCYAMYPEIESKFKMPDGNIYTLPVKVAGGDNQYINPETTIIRKDWIEKLGLDMPVTIDNWYTVLTAFKNDDPNGNGEADEIPFADEWYDIKLLARAWGIEYEGPWNVDENGTVSYGWIRENAKDYLTTMAQWYAEGLIYDQCVTVSGDVVEGYSLDDIVGSQINWSASNSSYLSKHNTVDPERANWVPIMMPKADENTKSLVYKSSVTNSGWFEVISADTENLDATLMLYDFFFSESGRELFNWGIEGVHWNWVDGEYQKTEEWIKTCEEDGMANYRIGGADNTPGWALEQTLDELFETWDVSTDIRTAVQEIKPQTSLRFPSDIISTEDESKVITSKWPDISTYLDEMFIRIITGELPVEPTFDEFVAKVKELGIDEIIAVKQAQYDRNK